MSPMRRDGAGRPEIAPTWDALVERLIREAMEEGAFDDLPYRGQRLPVDDDVAAGDRALAFRMLRNAGMAPPWIEADKDVRAILERIEATLSGAQAAGPLAQVRLRRELTRLVREANVAIERLNAEAPTDRQHRRPIDLAAILARIDGSGDGAG
jgi:hypothetical protein